MPILSAINYFLGVSLISILIFGILLTLNHHEKSIYRYFFISTLAFWTIMFTCVIIKFNIDGNRLYLNTGVFNMSLLVMGVPSFISIAWYPMIVMNANILKFRKRLNLLHILIIAIILYYALHIILGLNPNAHYMTLSELFQNITSLTVILRFVVLTIFIIYILSTLKNIMGLVPKYNRYVIENYSDTSYNVDWIRSLVYNVCCVTVTYLMLLFTSSLIVNFIYIVSIIMLFTKLIDRTLFQKIFDNSSEIKIKWIINKGWRIVEPEKPESLLEEATIEDIGTQIDKWMDSTKMYTRIDFALEDVLEAFPELIQDDLTQLFKSKGETFQSYVRKWRIKRACEILDNENDKIYPKQLYSMVGFSHYSSFSRAFTVVTGLSPTDYLKKRQ